VKGHVAVRDVAPHPDHGKNAGGEVGLAEQFGDLRAQVTLGLSPERASNQAVRRQAPQRPGGVEHLQHLGEVFGETGVFEVEAPAFPVVQLVADRMALAITGPYPGSMMRGTLVPPLSSEHLTARVSRSPLLPKRVLRRRLRRGKALRFFNNG
jgi:hypothetical protein